MLVSPDGLFALALHEGIVPGPYRDSVGVWTYGIGHTDAAGPPRPQDMRRGMPDDLDAAILRAIDLFRGDIVRYESDVRRALTRPVEQHQSDALVSFHYNTGAVGRATLTKRLNAGDIAGAGRAFMMWRKPPEIIVRRTAEQTLFTSGTYPTGTIPVWSVNDSGRVQWKAVRRLSRDAFLDLYHRTLQGPQ